MLEELLSDGPTASEDVLKKAKAIGLSRDTIWAAKKNLGVRARKEGLFGGWLWELPSKHTDLEEWTEKDEAVSVEWLNI